MIRSTYLQFLECPVCGRHYEARRVQTYCRECSSPLLARYDLEKASRELDRDEFQRRPRGMWRWQELLPVEQAENQVSIGEGDPPLLLLPHLGNSLGLERLFLKDESLNPTGTFKARGIAAAISKGIELGLSRFIIPTAGNAGGALAAYGARARVETCVIMPADTPAANQKECLAYGAQVITVPGLISDAARLAAQKSSQEGWFDVSTFKEPYRVEGKKIMGYELAEGFGWRLPEVILYPTGGGTGLVGMWKAFAELAALGWLEESRMPRLVSVQAEGCAPIVKAFHAGESASEFWQGAATVASGLRVPKSFADRLILRDLRDSQGTAVAVGDVEILQAQRELGAGEGIFAAPEGAATLAALKKLVNAKEIHPRQRIVLFNTGSGLKYV